MFSCRCVRIPGALSISLAAITIHIGNAWCFVLVLLMKPYFMDEICQTIKRATVYSFHVPPYLHGLVFFFFFLLFGVGISRPNEITCDETIAKNRTRQRWTEQCTRTWNWTKKRKKNSNKTQKYTQSVRGQMKEYKIDNIAQIRNVCEFFIQLYFDFGFVFHFSIFNRFYFHLFVYFKQFFICSDCAFICWGTHFYHQNTLHFSP